MTESLERSPLSPSLCSVPEDDWDCSLPDNATPTTPQNSIVFPENETPGKPAMSTHSKNASVQDVENGKGSRSLSELLRLHSEKDSKGNFSAEEAARIADVLGQWINASSSPYEAEDDFFVPSSSVQSMDDLSIASKRPSRDDFGFGRPRGRSECVNSTSTPS